MLSDGMDSRDLAIGIMFLSQTMVGILGNFSLLFHYVTLHHKEFAFKPMDLILTHLIIANSLFLLSKGVPHTMAAFGLSQSFSDVGCRFLLFVSRVGRSMSISITCLLSIFQAITISSRNSCWKDLKIKVPKHVALITSFCWSLHIGVNSIFPVYVLYAKLNSKNITKQKRYSEFCSIIGRDEITDLLYIVLLVFPEVLISGLIICTNTSIVVILYRHKRRVKYIRNTQDSLETSPETRATQSILALVFTFLTFYTLSSILYACSALYLDHSWYLVKITAFISLCFPTLCPFVIRSHDSIISRFCIVCYSMWKYLNSS